MDNMHVSEILTIETPEPYLFKVLLFDYLIISSCSAPLINACIVAQLVRCTKTEAVCLQNAAASGNVSRNAVNAVPQQKSCPRGLGRLSPPIRTNSQLLTIRTREQLLADVEAFVTHAWRSRVCPSKA